jgi:hypothetical protein
MVPTIPPAPPHFWLGTWSRPPDRPSQVALALAAVLLIVALVPGGPGWLVSVLDVTGAGDRKRRRRFLFVGSFVAAFLSLGYIAFYLRGGPRAPETGTYWLQGRALSHLRLSWSAADPTASFRAKNLLLTAPDRLAGIFPPGYALLLGPAFLLGAPMLVGPLLAAVLVPATWLLARELAAGAGEDDARAEWIGRIAAVLSLVSAALRYHTAESLPQGAAAAALTVALASALRARRTADSRLFGVAGLALGLLLATQPTSAVGAGIAVLTLFVPSRDATRSSARAFAWTCAAMLPGIALLLAANRAATGHAFTSPVSYYLARFGPAAPASSGAKASAMAALRRVRANLADVANFEPIALLPLLLLRPDVRHRVGRGALLAALVVGVQVLIAAPAGAGEGTSAVAGASALATVLPVQHALIALALGLALPPAWIGRAATATVAFALAGFAVHTSHEHARMAAEGLGRPHYEPDMAREAGATHGLLFFDEDEGYELAQDPGVSASHAVLAARLRGDDHDRMLFDLLGRPPTHRHLFSHNGPAVTSWTPNGGDTWRFEAEADFPPVATSDPSAGRIEVIDALGTCASDAHALAIVPAGAAVASVTLELPVPRGAAPAPRRNWMVTPRAFQRGGPGTGEVALVASLGGPPLAQWSWADAIRGAPTCTELAPKAVELGGDVSRAWLVVTARGGEVALDRTTLRAR